ncbi:hypothetical protein ACFL6U_10210 [Planctomycetota bacterium]
MSPSKRSRGRKVAAPNNIYTGILAMSFFILLATAAFTTFKCFTQYETLFTIP